MMQLGCKLSPTDLQFLSFSPPGYIVSHFRVTPNAYLDGYNRLHLTNVYPDGCAKRCVEEIAFDCLSFDYDRVNMECDLSDSSKTLIGNVLANPDWDYYEISKRC